MKTEDFLEFCAQFKTQGLYHTIRQTIFDIDKVNMGNIKSSHEQHL